MMKPRLNTKSYAELGDAYGVTRERIRTLVDRFGYRVVASPERLYDQLLVHGNSGPLRTLLASKPNRRAIAEAIGGVEAQSQSKAIKKPKPVAEEAKARVSVFSTPNDLAERYQVSKRTIFNWLENGTITPAFQRGKVIRFIIEDVDQELKEEA